jgi:hypothetical protein
MSAASLTSNGLFIASLVLGLHAAWLRWTVSFQTTPDRQRRREWYDTKWRLITASPWLNLPEIAVKWLVRLAQAMVRAKVSEPSIASLFLPFPAIGFLVWIAAHLPVQRTGPMPFLGPDPVAFLLYVSYVVLLFTLLIQFTKRHRPGYILLMIVTLALLVPALTIFDGIRRDVAIGAIAVICLQIDVMRERKFSSAWLRVIRALFVVVSLFLTAKMSIGIVRMIAISRLLPGVLFLFSVGAITLGTFWIFFQQQKVRTRVLMTASADAVLFAMTIATSFWITALALFIGHQLDPMSPIPATQRLFWTNAVCDGLTVVISLRILVRVVVPRSTLTVLSGAFLVSMVGLFFACASVWLGVRELSMPSVARILIGRSVEGEQWHFGPYFWAMHTVFIPLLCCFVMMWCCYLAKAVASFRQWFYSTARQDEINGLAMSSALLGLVVTSFGAIAAVIRWLSGT